ncbi:sensor histidine kinase [Pseudoalteromonas luteoviolacea]|uniref:sensor histidine kinase n=1 Tax=Pseudoalteromonas luteoviolacea TaxID=43657 RepID=UPI001B375C38|nr:ATP-binding protein [Pseudoalteromonas luteoviolacea]MBQ4837303.1 PAS domain-containing protein [Pseudoalteromonas luteoviolacea]
MEQTHRKLTHRAGLAIGVSLALACLPVGFLVSWPVWLWITLSAWILACVVLKLLLKPFLQTLDALQVGLLNFKDGDFSNQLAYQSNDDFGDLCRLYNDTAQQLRTEKQWLYQREMMLDKMLQSAPQALLLVNDQEVVVFANPSAQRLLGSSSPLEGSKVADLTHGVPKEIMHAITQHTDGLVSVKSPHSEEQIWHSAVGKLILNNQPHSLYIFKQLTRELNRQEVAVWKKVIRVISHELNNSLGPISSMLHSGKIIANKLDESRLNRVFSTIDERIEHLCEFIQGYGTFAKLPVPQIKKVELLPLLDAMQMQWPCTVSCEVSVVHADRGQLEQLLINLLKNAHESGSQPDSIELDIVAIPKGVKFRVSDSGPGMTQAVLTNALVPFYSTKASGSGLGLALCREIIDAHNGHISISNRAEGGLMVEVILPD